MTEDARHEPAWFLKAKCPVYLPQLDALTLEEDDFKSYLHHILDEFSKQDTAVQLEPDTDVSEAANSREGVHEIDMVEEPENEVSTEDAHKTGHHFLDGRLPFGGDMSDEGLDMMNKMFTDNLDVAYQSTKNCLVDLFYELEDATYVDRLADLLHDAWATDPLATLKIIMSARSIHLGKASRTVFYRSAGWLAEFHPLTLVTNLRWLSRPVIPKKLEKEGDEQMVFVEAEKSADDPAAFDVHNGVAHGYWKDLLNILALSANENLTYYCTPGDIMNVRGGGGPGITAEKAKQKRDEVRDGRHAAVVDALERPVHRALHLTVARLFAEQLQIDLGLLRGKDVQAKKDISLCAKWAPSTDRFHDKHTFIVSSIAEIMYPAQYFGAHNIELPSTGDSKADRTVYLRHAREAYRKDVSALRAQLEVVERSLAAKAYEQINYEHVPSVAMRNYAALFAEKDTERFSAYLDDVAESKANISGATLLPSKLIKDARAGFQVRGSRRKRAKGGKGGKSGEGEGLRAKIQGLLCKVSDSQWTTLVQRVKDSGKMEACMAVCDTSGSMMHPVFPDGTCPLDSSIGLSLLVAEVVKPPFGGAFITFSARPAIVKVDLDQPLSTKVSRMQKADWGMNTNFVSVFRDLILPVAIENKVRPEDMVKRVFVFSDMQFDLAEHGEEQWSSSYERIQKAYQDAGYEMPELVFWNLAGRHGSDFQDSSTAPKPVTADNKGTALMSGYSQGMLKVFMDDGMFEADGDEMEITEADTEEGEVLVEAKRRKIDPLSVVKKAIGHKAYDMLAVVD